MSLHSIRKPYCHNLVKGSQSRLDYNITMWGSELWGIQDIRIKACCIEVDIKKYT